MKRILIALLLSLGIATPSAASRRLDFPGGWYTYACTNGEYSAIIRNSHLETHRGQIALPSGGNPLYLDLPCDGSSRIAGIGNADDRAWEWQGHWHDRGMAFGVNGVIYDATNQLRIVWGPGTPTGSQGWRYVADDGRLITGDESYADPGNHLWEYTIRGDIRCGQGGDEEGLQCLIRGRRVLVEPGIIRFINFERAGDQLALSWVRQDTASSTALWLTAQELDALPTFTLPGTGPAPSPKPLPSPVPPPQPDCSRGWTPRMPNRQKAVEDLATQFPDEWVAMNTQDDMRFIKRLAWLLHQEDPSWGLNGKRQTETLSPDVLVYLNPTVNNGAFPGVEAVDFIIAHGHPSAHPGWLNITCPMNEGGSGGRWFKPEPVDGTPGPGPTPQPPPSGDIELLKKEIEVLRQQVSLLSAVNDEANRRLDALTRELDESRADRNRLAEEIERLKNQPPPTCQVNGPGWVRSLFNINCRIVQ